jgi:hypothetical protein
VKSKLAAETVIKLEPAPAAPVTVVVRVRVPPEVPVCTGVATVTFAGVDEFAAGVVNALAVIAFGPETVALIAWDAVPAVPKPVAGVLVAVKAYEGVAIETLCPANAFVTAPEENPVIGALIATAPFVLATTFHVKITPAVNELLSVRVVPLGALI